jgi:ATP-dependent helicase HrpA
MTKGGRARGPARESAPAGGRGPAAGDRGRARERAVARRAEGREHLLAAVRYPPELPLTVHRDEILAALRDHQVVVVAGETGSGKTTQLPKMCLESGRGVAGMIGHTQPRRIAARSVAERIAEELGVPLGGPVGYQVRFTDQVGPDTLVKVMTDGILLAELQRDRRLSAYDTVIIDEAHERSLNIDFLLGYLKHLLPQRPELRVIVTSATIDTERFSQHFDDAPIVEVSGRAYPVEVRYRPFGLPPDDDRDQVQAIVDGVSELVAEGVGDILVFLSGEREIRDAADALADAYPSGVDVLPLYARLSSAEQHRVFLPHAGRRVVLATNVAETSLTVPGIRYVIDPGTARVSRFNRRTKVQRLPIERVSQASANQRAGRCGRVGPGVCIRLYSEEDFVARAEFTEPEILRTNLASVILQMAALELGDVVSFPFVDPPDRRAVADGVALLEELGALAASRRGDGHRLTPIGRRLAQLPIDPRLGRMVLEAAEQGCLREVLVIAAALSIQDPRERPSDQQTDAEALHRRFVAEGSDFLTFVNLWDYLRAQQRALSSNQFRRLCRGEYLNYLRVREWQDLHTQLRRAAHDLRLAVNADAAPADRVHYALLAGLLSHVGVRDADGADPPRGRDARPPSRRRDADREYAGARGARFVLAPDSVLARAKPPRWVQVAELVETNRLWGRTAAPVQPAWVERLGSHLVTRSHSEPRWDARRGAAIADERVSLYGLTLVAARRVDLPRVDPELARQLFIRHALVGGEWTTHHEFVRRNDSLTAQVGELEHRARRALLCDEEALFDFFEGRVPREVRTTRDFDRWWRTEREQQPDLLDFTAALLTDGAYDTVDVSGFPDTWTAGAVDLRLSYAFAPGEDGDGVTVHVPLAVLASVDPAGFDWNVPGLRSELVTALIRSLPKAVRRHFVPAPEYAAAVLAKASPDDGSLVTQLEQQLPLLTGEAIPAGSWDFEHVPAHLRMTFQVEDSVGEVLGRGKDLAALQRRLRRALRRHVVRSLAHLERDDIRDWDFGALAQQVEVDHLGYRVEAFPALVDLDGRPALRLQLSREEQAQAMWAGTRRLLLNLTPIPAKQVHRALSNDAKLALARHRHAGLDELVADCTIAAADKLLADAGGPVWTAEGFDALRRLFRAHLADMTIAAVTIAARILVSVAGVEDRLGRLRTPALRAPVEDIDAQLDLLVRRPDFVSAAGAARLPDLRRYVRAVERRLDKLAEDPARDRLRMLTVHRLTEELRATADQVGSARARDAPAVRDIEWMIEELRVSLFAQALGTAHPVSPERVRKAIAALRS